LTHYKITFYLNIYFKIVFISVMKAELSAATLIWSSGDIFYCHSGLFDE